MPEEQEFEIDNSKQEPDLGLRDRDVRNLSELLGKLDTFVIDEYFARGRDGVVMDEALDYYVAFREYERSSEFQIHDEDLKIVIGAFSDAWDVCVAYEDYFFPILSGQAYQFKSHHHTDDPDEVLKVRGQFTSDLLDAEREYQKLIEYIKAHYPEVDFKETNRRARESYAAELNWVGDPDKEETREKNDFRAEAEAASRESGRTKLAHLARRIAKAIPVILLILIFFFGNNAYQQATGQSFYQEVGSFIAGIWNALSGEPTVTETVPPPIPTAFIAVATAEASAANSSATLSPTRVLPAVYDAFDECIDRRKWDRIALPTPRSPQVTTEGCLLLDNEDSVKVAFAEDASLVFSSLEPWQDGLTLVQYESECKVREVYLEVTDLQINGKGWIGLTVDHPQKSPEVISVWLGRFIEDELPLEVRSTNTHSPLSQNERTGKLVEDLPDSGPYIVGVIFEDGRARSLIDYGDETDQLSELASGYANNFSIVFRVGEKSELLARIAEVRIRWEPEECGPSNLP